MFHRLRALHKTIGLIACLFLLVISATGFFLAMKSRFAWIRPETQSGAEMVSLASAQSLEAIAQAAYAAGSPHLKSIDDVDRFEYHVDKNVMKLTSKDGYAEVQVDVATGKVLSVGTRNDQLLEDIHDMSYFADWVHGYGLPVIALFLFVLALTGICLYFVPVFRRMKFRREKARSRAP